MHEVLRARIHPQAELFTARHDFSLTGERMSPPKTQGFLPGFD
ncbi:MAG: hypothetical protein JWQ04_3528, partial [Pedosphaera sp.]|nr:hypothetical protein [Pedosphaera sp.]